MMPRAANARSFHQPLREGTVIVATGGSDGENLFPDPHKQDILVADMSEQLVVLECRKRNTLAEIGTARRRLLLRHRFLPNWASWHGDPTSLPFYVGCTGRGIVTL